MSAPTPLDEAERTRRSHPARTEADPESSGTGNGEFPASENREHDLTMHVFTISAGLIGVCLTAIGLIRIFSLRAQVETMADELLALDAVLFVSCCFLSFWSFKTHRTRVRLVLRQAVDALFMIALLFMVVVCGLIAYEVV